MPTRRHKQTTAELEAAFSEELASYKEAADAAKAAAKASGAATNVSKKAKVTQKTGGVKRQWDILLASGVPSSEIPRFVDATHWLAYFPPFGVSDLRHAGAAIDFRRSFITTDANPVRPKQCFIYILRI